MILHMIDIMIGLRMVGLRFIIGTTSNKENPTAFWLFNGGFPASQVIRNWLDLMTGYDCEYDSEYMLFTSYCLLRIIVIVERLIIFSMQCYYNIDSNVYANKLMLILIQFNGAGWPNDRSHSAMVLPCTAKSALGTPS